ncbi:hypothetical protein ASF84_09665 [Pseudomonas sp. Leaf127]|uniref:hypothetical protein n=1 Tax=Pseudomonas sp. Leaf127 TaxID=1736267 RepID=UPI000703168A|nr:hypothetical protein [Pseudomonas sp. Leaf127]KQQ55599.1 hypothetical protein ASF84_09665 [Pseudomonas sp. Leaf127]
MKRTVVLIIACACSPAWSAGSLSSVAQPLGKHMQTLSNAFVCDVMAGTPGINNTPQCRDRNNPARTESRELDRTADRKTLRECMKPDNLIDEDVRKCMKGL